MFSKKDILESYKSNYPSLSSEELDNAVKDKLIYPQVFRERLFARSESDKYAVWSFALIEEELQKSLICIRGVYNDYEMAVNKCKEIIQNVNSKFPIVIGKIGEWHPITGKPEQFSQETIHVIDNQEYRRKLDENVRKMLELAESKEDERILQEKTILEERKNILFNKSDTDSIREYIRRIIMCKETQEHINYAGKKIDILQKRLECLSQMVKLQSFIDWYEVYETEMKSIGNKNLLSKEKLMSYIVTDSNNLSLQECASMISKLEEDYNSLKL